MSPSGRNLWIMAALGGGGFMVMILAYGMMAEKYSGLGPLISLSRNVGATFRVPQSAVSLRRTKDGKEDVLVLTYRLGEGEEASPGLDVRLVAFLRINYDPAKVYVQEGSNPVPVRRPRYVRLRRAYDAGGGCSMEERYETVLYTWPARPLDRPELVEGAPEAQPEEPPAK